MQSSGLDRRPGNVVWLIRGFQKSSTALCGKPLTRPLGYLQHNWSFTNDTLPRRSPRPTLLTSRSFFFHGHRDEIGVGLLDALLYTIGLCSLEVVAQQA